MTDKQLIALAIEMRRKQKLYRDSGYTYHEREMLRAEKDFDRAVKQRSGNKEANVSPTMWEGGDE